MKIAHKLLVVPTAALACLLCLGGLSYFSMQANERRLLDLKDVTFAALQLASQQSITLGQVHASTYARIAIAGSLSEEDLKKYGAQANASLAAIGAELDKLKTMPGAGEAAQAAAFPAVQANAWLLHAGGKTKVAPDTVGIPKP